MTSYTMGSLFSGIGGFDLGFDLVGVPTAWQVEGDKYARAVLKHHYPNTTQYEDVRNVGKANLSAVDVISGGFPCQDVSIAGNRKGLVGERSGLWYEYCRILAEMQPRYCIIENVPGLLSSQSGRDFAIILHGLAECGYSVAWRVLDLRYFGIPQRRRRVFIVGSLGNGSSAQILFERESGSGHSTQGGKTREGTADGAQNRLVGTLAASSAGTARPAGQANELDMLVYDGQQITSPTHRGQGSSISPTLGNSNGGNMLLSQAVDVRNLALSDETSGTLQAKKTGGYSLNYQNPVLRGGRVRRLTPLEVERLMGFPDGWTAKGQSDSRRYHQLGNAVGVPIAEWIAERIVSCG